MTDQISDLSLAGSVPTLRSLVEERLRSAIASGMFKPGQRLIERELCEVLGVGRTSVREALRRLEAEGLVTTIAHRGPVVSTISVDEAKQLYKMRELLEGFAGRECARNCGADIIARLEEQVAEMRLAVEKDDRKGFLASKTGFYTALLDGCGNIFARQALDVLLNRVTLLRITSMTHAGRIHFSLAEIEQILAAIKSGDGDAAEAACVTHVRNAAEAALKKLASQVEETPAETAKT